MRPGKVHIQVAVQANCQTGWCICVQRLSFDGTCSISVRLKSWCAGADDADDADKADDADDANNADDTDVFFIMLICVGK